MRLTCSGATHLAGKAITIEHDSASFLRYTALKGGLRLGRKQDVLPWFQLGAIIVGKDLISFFISQLADPSRPFAYSTRRLSQRIAIEHNPKIAEKIITQKIARAQFKQP
jgi:hypothetical protein